MKSSPAQARIWRSLRRARKGIEDDDLRQRHEEMERRWYQFDEHFNALRQEYELLATMRVYADAEENNGAEDATTAESA